MTEDPDPTGTDSSAEDNADARDTDARGTDIEGSDAADARNTDAENSADARNSVGSYADIEDYHDARDSDVEDFDDEDSDARDSDARDFDAQIYADIEYSAARGATPRATPIQDTEGGPSAEEYLDIKRILAYLTELVGRELVAPAEASVSRADEIAGRDAAFRYRLLSALMGAGSLEDLAVVVIREGGDLVVDRPAGLHRGTHLAFVAGNTSVNLGLLDDRLDEDQLTAAGVDIRGPLDRFELRHGRAGPIVAVAPALDPVPTPVPVPGSMAAL